MVKYTHEEVYQSTLEYFKGDTLATEVWIKKYCLKNDKDELIELNPNDMHRRLAREFARIEANYPNPLTEEEIFDVLKDFKYIVPQGSPMAGVGDNFRYVSVSNCFVVGNEKDEDSYGGILKLDQELVQLMKRRAGVGIDLSFIRPNTAPVKNSARTSTGIASFMERYSNSTREVAQGGRRGALMLSTSIQHPDAEAFIDAKMTEGKVTGANVSVKITDDFMTAVSKKEDFIQHYPLHIDPLSNPDFAESYTNGLLKTNELYVLGDNQFAKIVDTSALWNKIVHNAWSSAEPGILFWDTIIKESLPDCYADLGFKTVSTNPCGEIPLCADDSCRLMAINLYSYVKNPFKKGAYFDFELFNKHVIMAQRLMDDLIDIEIEKVDKIIGKIEADPESEKIKRVELEMWQSIRQKALEGRRTGLGITGTGDMLAALGLTYGTQGGNDFIENVHLSMKLSAYRSSNIMAKERGAFPIWEPSREENNPFLLRIKAQDPILFHDLRNEGRRNIAALTVAPTGSVSILTQTTSGIEPAFLIYYTRRRKVNPGEDVKVDFVDEVGDSWQEYPVFHHHFITWAVANGIPEKELKAMSKLGLDKLIATSPYHKATSNDVDWVKKVEMQGRVQKHIDHSISVTVNLPNDVSEEMVGKVYMKAWESGCKGITVYRDGSRSGVLVSSTEKKGNTIPRGEVPVRPKSLDARVLTFMNGADKWVAVIGLLDNQPYEIFTGKATDSFSVLTQVKKGWVVKVKKGDDPSRYDFRYKDPSGYNVTIEGLCRTFDSEYWNYARMISSVLRHGMPIDDVVNLVNSLNLQADTLNNWKNGVARALRQFVEDGTISSAKCPSCETTGLVYEDGCMTCKNCGHSECN